MLELDESFEDGVRREVAEETGMLVTIESLSGVYKNLARGIVALVFRCTPHATAVRATAEAREVRWMTRDEDRQHMDPAFAIPALDAFEPGTQMTLVSASSACVPHYATLVYGGVIDSGCATWISLSCAKTLTIGHSGSGQRS